MTPETTTPYWHVVLALVAVGVGTGLFLTKRQLDHGERASGASGERERRAVDTASSGSVVNTSMSLAIVTSTLSPSEIQSAYAGAHRISGNDVARFAPVYHVASFVLFGRRIAGAGASLVRDKTLARAALYPRPSQP